MSVTATSTTARRFLLGQLPVDEAEAFEEQLLRDDELVAETDAVQAELYDEYVRGELTAEQHSAFARRFGPDPEKLALARALSTRTSGRWSGMVRNTLPIAASIVVLASVTLLWMRPEPAVAPPPVRRVSSKPAAAPTAPPEPTSIAKARKIAVVTLALAATRDDEATPSLVLANDLDDVMLRIRINPADRFDSYAVDLTTGSGASVWSGPAARDAATSELTATIPASSLKAGNHQIAVSGVSVDGTREELGYQPLLIREP